MRIETGVRGGETEDPLGARIFLTGKNGDRAKTSPATGSKLASRAAQKAMAQAFHMWFDVPDKDILRAFGAMTPGRSHTLRLGRLGLLRIEPCSFTAPFGR
jgi:hypothetical protein